VLLEDGDLTKKKKNTGRGYWVTTSACSEVKIKEPEIIQLVLSTRLNRLKMEID
jgi:negative regulator of replication initiation